VRGGASALIDFRDWPDFRQSQGFYTNSNKSLAAGAEKYYKCFFLSSSFQTPLLMRSKLLASFLIAILSASCALGCAFEGTIVEKRSWLRPDASMIGTEGVYSFVFRGPTGISRLPITVPNPQFWTETSGSYKFHLRDRQGNVHCQLVTAEVFAHCRVGDYFNDRGPACAPPDAKDSKATVAVIHRQRHHRMAQARRSHRKLATHHHCKRSKALAYRPAGIVPQG
jgi:hypothetical protein